MNLVHKFCYFLGEYYFSSTLISGLLIVKRKSYSLKIVKMKIVKNHINLVQFWEVIICELFHFLAWLLTCSSVLLFLRATILVIHIFLEDYLFH